MFSPSLVDPMSRLGGHCHVVHWPQSEHGNKDSFSQTVTHSQTVTQTCVRTGIKGVRRHPSIQFIRALPMQKDVEDRTYALTALTNRSRLPLGLNNLDITYMLEATLCSVRTEKNAFVSWWIMHSWCLHNAKCIDKAAKPMYSIIYCIPWATSNSYDTCLLCISVV